MGGRPDQVLLAEEPYTHGIDQWVPAVARCKTYLTPKRRDPDAVAVVSHAPNHTREEIPIAPFLEWTETKAVEKSHRTSTHGEDVAQDATHAGRGSLVGLNRRGMIVGLDLKRYCPALR